MLLLTLFVCIGCEWQFSSSNDDVQVTVERYDRIQSLYLTTGDFSALQQMNTIYPMQTRTLIEDVLRIGKVDDQQINTKFLRFYQDSTLQSIISEAEQQYANMDDINKGLTSAFAFLKSNLPNMEVPKVYSQIGSLDQSIIVGNNTIGFYLLSLYPMPADRILNQEDRDLHIGKIQWAVNKAMGASVFASDYIALIEKYMSANKNITIDQMLRNNVYSDFRK